MFSGADEDTTWFPKNYKHTGKERPDPDLLRQAAQTLAKGRSSFTIRKKVSIFRRAASSCRCQMAMLFGCVRKAWLSSVAAAGRSRGSTRRTVTAFTVRRVYTAASASPPMRRALRHWSPRSRM